MGKKDLYEKLLKYYEFQIGTFPRKAQFKRALQEMVAEEDLRVFFLLPFLGTITKDKLERKARRAGISVDALQDVLRRLVPRGIVGTYVSDEGRVYERTILVALLEMSVRDPVDSVLRQVSAQVMNDLIEGTADTIPTKTPYYRVLPVEAAVSRESKSRVIPVNAIIPDARQVLSIDQVSEMIRDEPVIALAVCYCRAAKQHIGEECEHPKETCFFLNELGQKQIEAGQARQVDYEEAMRVLWECEEAGLVHNVSNCEGRIQTLCNCCECSCGVLRAWNRGETYATAPSRYIVALEADKCSLQKDCVDACPVGALSVAGETLHIEFDRCFGCGQCVAACPEGALYLAQRDEPPKIFVDNDALFRKINSEAMVGLVVRKITGR